jgi:hypothetical protein
MYQIQDGGVGKDSFPGRTPNDPADANLESNRSPHYQHDPMPGWCGT